MVSADPRHPRCPVRPDQHGLAHKHRAGSCIGAREIRFGAGIRIRTGSRKRAVGELSLFLCLTLTCLQFGV